MMPDDSLANAAGDTPTQTESTNIHLKPMTAPRSTPQRE
jgi:hypothetical protein